MTNKLIAFGLLVAIYFVFFLNALLIWNAGIPEEISNHYLGESGLLGFMYGLFAVVPVHLGLIIWANRKHKVAWYVALPLFLMPYMVGTIIQGLIF